MKEMTKNYIADKNNRISLKDTMTKWPAQEQTRITRCYEHLLTVEKQWCDTVLVYAYKFVLVSRFDTCTYTSFRLWTVTSDSLQESKLGDDPDLSFCQLGSPVAALPSV